MLSYFGYLKYFDDKLIVEVDQSFANFYYSLIPKYLGVKRQMWPAHISVVRKEIPLNKEYWNKYSGEKTDFEYDNWIYNGTVYYWINIFSKRLEEIRLELGLPVSSEYTVPPEGYVKCYHLSLG